MIDLTKNTTPFGLMDEVAQRNLKTAASMGSTVETYTTHGTWRPTHTPQWFGNVIYRVKRGPLIETQVHEVSIAAFKSQPPILSTTNTEPPFVAGKLTLTTEDGKPVSATWKAGETP